MTTRAIKATWFQRFLLPGFAFKAVVIGGGYATGRELAEFFLPAGARGGLAGMALATVLWSVICATTFTLAHTTHAYDYRSFFKALLGSGWVAFEIAYVLFVILVLAVFGAAAGAIGAAVLGLPPSVGTAALAGLIALFATFGNASVERLFKYVTVLLYTVYALFLLLSVTQFGDRIGTAFAAPAHVHDWALGGLTYASYNVVGAVVILPVLRHLTSTRDAVVAGLVAGPLAMLPAIAFFVVMAAFPEVAGVALPSDFLLRQLDLPLFHLAFQLMIFAALLESGTGLVHAINERIAAAWTWRRGTPLAAPARAGIAVTLLVGCMLIADRFGLVALIAGGYRFLAYTLLAVYIAPLFAFGLWQLRRSSASRATAIRSRVTPARTEHRR